MPIETITIDTEQWAVVPMELLSELAESLACELDARYPACNRAYPSQERKYQSAMEPVFKSRALLLTQQPEQAQRSTTPELLWAVMRDALQRGSLLERKYLNSEDPYYTLDKLSIDMDAEAHGLAEKLALMLHQPTPRPVQANVQALVEALEDALEYLQHHLPDEAIAPHRSALAAFQQGDSQ